MVQLYDDVHHSSTLLMCMVMFFFSHRSYESAWTGQVAGHLESPHAQGGGDGEVSGSG